jgi:hypothetical protein
LFVESSNWSDELFARRGGMPPVSVLFVRTHSCAAVPTLWHRLVKHWHMIHTRQYILSIQNHKSIWLYRCSLR